MYQESLTKNSPCRYKHEVCDTYMYIFFPLKSELTCTFCDHLWGAIKMASALRTKQILKLHFSAGLAKQMHPCVHQRPGTKDWQSSSCGFGQTEHSLCVGWGGKLHLCDSRTELCQGLSGLKHSCFAHRTCQTNNKKSIG